MHEAHESIWSDPHVWVAISFLIFVILAARTGWKRITAMLDARSRRIQEELEEAVQLRREAEQMRKDAERDSACILAEAKAMVERAEVEAARLLAAAAAEAEASAKRRERMAMDRIAAAEASAVADVRNAAADVASTAARDILTHGLDAAADAKLVDNALNELPKALRAA